MDRVDRHVDRYGCPNRCIREKNLAILCYCFWHFHLDSLLKLFRSTFGPCLGPCFGPRLGHRCLYFGPGFGPGFGPCFGPRFGPSFGPCFGPCFGPLFGPPFGPYSGSRRLFHSTNMLVPASRRPLHFCFKTEIDMIFHVVVFIGLTWWDGDRSRKNLKP